MRAAVAERRSRVNALERALGAFGPQATLERGYSILLRADDRRVVRDAHAVQAGERLHARLARGTLELDIAGTEPDG
jgi:exodeoxyribonuclease VII large subunit